MCLVFHLRFFQPLEIVLLYLPALVNGTLHANVYVKVELTVCTVLVLIL